MEEVNYITILDGFLERSRNELLTSNNIDQDAVFSIINAEIQRIYSIDSEVYQDFSYNILPHFYIVENPYRNGIFQDIKRRVSINHNINNNFSKAFITLLLAYMAVDSGLVESNSFLLKYIERWGSELKNFKTIERNFIDSFSLLFILKDLEDQISNELNFLYNRFGSNREVIVFLKDINFHHIGTYKNSWLAVKLKIIPNILQPYYAIAIIKEAIRVREER
ncbi:hypothetical protein [uncultured Campylobacter sp.]|uniref:hypothetical protein n=2 Tax=uncultured Campylobacter sp. TaxID=218934 RepID=UPI00262050FF|nr:hypothetical protein [uncultured Campylobacter sp.]